MTEIDWEDEFHKFLVEKGIVEQFKNAYHHYSQRVGRSDTISDFIRKQDYPGWITDHCFGWTDANRRFPAHEDWYGVHLAWGKRLNVIKQKQRG